MALYGRKPIGTIAYMGGVVAIPEEFTYSLANMIAYNYEYVCLPNEYIHLDRAKISYHCFARNSLVDRMKGDWLLMLDTDHRFDPDVCARILHLAEKYKVDVISGIYCYKYEPYSPVAFRWNGEGYEPIGDWDRSVDLFRVDSSGAGCLWVRKNVFKRIKSELKCGPFDIEWPYSEDHSFFNKLRKLEIKAYCAPLIEADHLTVTPVKIDNYKPVLESLGPRFEVEGFKDGETIKV
jgi:hypothetical protein